MEPGSTGPLDGAATRLLSDNGIAALSASGGVETVSLRCNARPTLLITLAIFTQV
jgi:hypothetical protein